MTRRRWIADEVNHRRAALVGAHAAHLSRTLRAQVGQEFEVACGDQVRRAVVASVDHERVEFELGEEITVSAPLPITLLLAVFKFDRMEWAIEKCTELNGRGRGDQFVHLKVETPTKLTRRQRELLEELEQTLSVENKPVSRSLLSKMREMFG